MPEAIVRLNGMISMGRDNSCIVSFEEPSIRLEMLLAILKAEVPSKTIAFCAVNGSEATADSMINDGDVIDIFPVAAGADKINGILKKGGKYG